jgi:hypothetical protein
MLSVSVGYVWALRLIMAMEKAKKKWIRVLVVGNAPNLAAFLMNSLYSSSEKFGLKLLSLFAWFVLSLQLPHHDHVNT